MAEDRNSPLLIEIAWEVCNQVGGIYTVLRTKASSIQEKFGSSYFLVGPYNQTNAQIEFERVEPGPLISRVIARLNVDRERVRFGRWLIPGEPQVLLLDYELTPEELASQKIKLWESDQISTLTPDTLVDQVIGFGTWVSRLVETIEEESSKKIIAHFHEWMSGVTIPLLPKSAKIKSVFTTHATLVGRYVAGDNRPLYQLLDTLDADEASRYYCIEARHQIERTAARNCDVFSTVSDVTGREAEKFLGRRPDAVLPNGLNSHSFTALHEFQNLHRVYKEQIHEFVMAHFFPSYTFDLDRTLYFLISGRYEYRNKGMDVFIASLARLNARLLQEKDPPTIVAFIITSRPVRHLNVEALRGTLLLHELRTVCRQVQEQIGDRIFASALEKRLPTLEDLLPRETVARLKRAYLSFDRRDLPSVSIHEFSDAEDPVMKQLTELGLNNCKENPVKVVYHPEFITATNPPLNLDYDQFVRGCHLGVFPSYYEPWGYTPLECIALGLPTVTTDLSGFGGYVQENIHASAENGILVLKRALKGDDEVMVDLANYLYWFSQRSRRERIETRNKSERLTEHFDWNRLSRHYLSVYRNLS